MPSSSSFDFDSALLASGGFGRWQRRNFAILSFVVAASGLAVVTWTFAAFQVGIFRSVKTCS